MIEAVAQRYSVKKVFLKMSQNSQENTCDWASFLIKLQIEFCESFKNTLFYRTPLVVASALSSNVRNTRIYNFISVPQITRFLLGDTIILSKADLYNSRKKEKISYGEVKSNKTMLKILPFIRIYYLKQESSILWCFCRLKFEKKFI